MYGGIPAGTNSPDTYDVDEGGFSYKITPYDEFDYTYRVFWSSCGWYILHQKK